LALELEVELELGLEGLQLELEELGLEELGLEELGLEEPWGPWLGTWELLARPVADQQRVEKPRRRHGQQRHDDEENVPCHN